MSANVTGRIKKHTFMKKRRYRIRWGRVALLVLFLTAVGYAIYYAIVGIGMLFSLIFGPKTDKAEEDKVEVINVSKEQLDESSRMTQLIDSMMHQPMRLDTALIAISIYDLTTEQQIYSMHDKQLLPPASCMKISTAIAALKTLGMKHEYHVSLMTRGKMRGDTLVGNVLLKADDDPLFEDMPALARQLRDRGVRNIRGNVYMMLAREDTLRPHPTAKLWDIPFHKTPLLLKGKKTVNRHLMASLRSAGISYRRDNSVRPAGMYRAVATTSHRLTDVITPMMIHSSNIKADAVLYHLDYKQGIVADKRIHWDQRHATEIFWRKIMNADSTNVMQGFVFNDGSGLSPTNRMTAAFLVDMLRYAYKDKQLREYLIKEAMATPGEPSRRGSLLSRLAHTDYRDRIFVKTGTMTTIGGSSLAGYIHGHDGHWYAFSIINTDSPVAESRIFQDRLCKTMMRGKIQRR